MLSLISTLVQVNHSTADWHYTFLYNLQLYCEPYLAGFPVIVLELISIQVLSFQFIVEYYFLSGVRCPLIIIIYPLIDFLTLWLYVYYHSPSFALNLKAYHIIVRNFNPNIVFRVKANNFHLFVILMLLLNSIISCLGIQFINVHFEVPIIFIVN